MDELLGSPELIDEIALIYLKEWLARQPKDKEISVSAVAHKFIEIRKEIRSNPRSR